MNPEAWQGILIPFLGTSLGAACVFVMRGCLSAALRRALTGFAAGVMTAASVWSLLLPAVELSGALGRWAFLPAAAGFGAGVLFLLALNKAAPRLPSGGPRARPGSAAMLALAVTIHNLPEGMAVGVAYAGWLRGDAGVSAAGALALSLGIAIQNFPEGAIISMPLRAQGAGRGRAFLCGALSGAVEPVGALLTIWFSALAVPLLPYFLAFAAGAMLYVVADDLIPDASDGGSGTGPLLFALGFAVMMSLDCALG